MSNIIKDCKSKTRLIQEIVKEYIKHISEQLKSNQSVLDDENWASDKNDEYHKQCRKELKDENDIIRNQLKLLIQNK
jgi:HPt (histidine-containing phosphotransfer) domain-containing protein